MERRKKGGKKISEKGKKSCATSVAGITASPAI